MKDAYNLQQTTYCRPLKQSDLNAYCDYYAGLVNPSHFRGLLKDKDIRKPESYQDIFDSTVNDPNSILFGLFQGKKIIGQACFFYYMEDGENKAMIQGLDVDDSHRGRGISLPLIKAIKKHLKDTNFSGDLLTSYHDTRTQTKRITGKMGFLTDRVTTGENGQRVTVVKLRI